MMSDVMCEKEAITMLSHIYYKMLKVNLTTDSHDDIKVIDTEITPDNGYSDKISDWLRGIANAGLVHPDDTGKYLQFTDIDNLRDAFLKGNTYICCRYRRKINDIFCPVSMELIAAPEYRHDNQIVYLYMKEICDEYETVPDHKDPDGMIVQGLNKTEDVPPGKELSLTDFIPAETLQNIQDAFSNMTGMAALTTDKYGVPVTEGSRFTDFCMKYTRQSDIGRQRCEHCDKSGAELAYRNGRSCVYECHAGLMDYAAPIMVNGEMIGCFIGGQVLPEKPVQEKYHRIAKEIHVDPEAYLKALNTVYIIDRQSIDHAANFLYVIANILSDIAYNKHTADVSNKLLYEKNQQLDFMANHDMLTKLSNRHHIQIFFQQYAQSAKPYCVIIGDIDNFKSVNDTYGHSCGDVVLSNIAGLIKNNFPDTAVVCRWGGEEFLILLYGDKNYAVSVLEAVDEKIRSTPISYNENTLHITMTFGIAFCGEQADVEKLIILADERLYYGKKHGKNQIVDMDMNVIA